MQLPGYFGSIDQLRFVAAMAVVLHHYPLFFRQTEARNHELAPINPDIFFTALAVPFFWTDQPHLSGPI